MKPSRLLAHIGSRSCSVVALMVGTCSSVLGAELAPVLEGRWPEHGRGWAVAVAVSGNCAYVAVGEAGLMVIDVTNPASPQRVGQHNTRGYILGAAVSGRYA